MTQWEPIAGNDIRVGDVITDTNPTSADKYGYYYIVTGLESRDNIPGCYIQFQSGNVCWYSLDTFRYVRVEKKEYDPSQQPYEDSDI